MNLTNTRPKTPRKFRRGFTLIEMLIVVAIIGLLVSIAVPALKTAKADTQAAKKNTLRTSLTTAINRAVLNGELSSGLAVTYNHFKKYVQINGKTAPPILEITDGTKNGTGENIVYWGYIGNPEYGDPGESFFFQNDMYIDEITIIEAAGLPTTPITLDDATATQW